MNKNENEYVGRRRALSRVLAGGAFAIFVGFAPAAASAATWTGEFLLGSAVNVPSQLTIEQRGEPDVSFRAHWSTRPLDSPVYWAVRIGRVGSRHAWHLELLHDKLYLENAPTEVQNFSVTHGLNLLTLQHGWRRSWWCGLALAGVAVAHPENTVRGRRWAESGGLFGAGYQVAGPVIGAGAGGIVSAASWLALSGEVRVTHAWLDLHVVDGEAHTRNLALHVLLGPRLQF